MMSAEKTSLPGLIEQGHYSQSELHGFEVDMYGRVIVPEFHPRTPDAVSAYIKFEPELLATIDAAAWLSAAGYQRFDRLCRSGAR